MQSPPITGVILAGGLNTRFQGQAKAFQEIGGRCIMDRLMDVYTGLFDDIIIVTNEPMRYMAWDAQIVTDVLPQRSALTGIHAGLFYAHTEHVFFAACDIPFLKADVVRLVLDAVAPDIDAVIPETNRGFEPLCAVYATRLMAAAAHHVQRGDYKIRRAFRKRRIRTVSEKRLRAVDPELVSFFNVNTPEDLIKAAQYDLKAD
ncbi:MAG: molybdenum cofactor guanylyltransferase [Pseudomonadota bacterium]